MNDQLSDISQFANAMLVVAVMFAVVLIAYAVFHALKKKK